MSTESTYGIPNRNSGVIVLAKVEGNKTSEVLKEIDTTGLTFLETPYADVYSVKKGQKVLGYITTKVEDTYVTLLNKSDNKIAGWRHVSSSDSFIDIHGKVRYLIPRGLKELLVKGEYSHPVREKIENGLLAGKIVGFIKSSEGPRKIPKENAPNLLKH